MKCPGMDLKYWKIEDIFDVNCPVCQYKNEVWKDDIYVICCHCRIKIKNPRLNINCADYCESAQDCPGVQMQNANIIR